MNSEQRVLIISKNVLSETNNNGKTILSFFSDLPTDSVCQLFFSDEKPAIAGYRYYKYSDKDQIRGILDKNKRGYSISPSPDDKPSRKEKKKEYGPLMRILREILWLFPWRSDQLNEWLHDFMPTIVFFVGGNSCYTCRISREIVKEFDCRYVVYITDDYLIKRKKDSLFGRILRAINRNCFLRSVKESDCFLTISDYMKETYKNIFGIESIVAVNMPDPMYVEEYRLSDSSEGIRMVYAGSIYYGREDVLGEISNAVEAISSSGLEVSFDIYTNITPSEESLKNMVRGSHTHYGGSLDKEQLIKTLNKADVLVFVESFAEEQIEKTKYSLSTKIPEYLSLKKPIFAVGPADISSMRYISETAMCSFGQEEICSKLKQLLSSKQTMDYLAQKGYQKYLNNHASDTQRPKLLSAIFGE